MGRCALTNLRTAGLSLGQIPQRVCLPRLNLWEALAKTCAWRGCLAVSRSNILPPLPRSASTTWSRWSRSSFRQLPGGILSKGIIRGYADAVGLDQHDWTERFLKAYSASGLKLEDPDWSAFASNVGRARLARREASELRLRWAGALVLLLAVAAAGFLMVRYYGMRAGWWSGPALHPAFQKLHAIYISARSWVTHIFA